jgi:hypothetical protein
MAESTLKGERQDLIKAARARLGRRFRRLILTLPGLLSKTGRTRSDAYTTASGRASLRQEHSRQGHSPATGCVRSSANLQAGPERRRGSNDTAIAHRSPISGQYADR